jgi:hypothetical protein
MEMMTSKEEISALDKRMDELKEEGGFLAAKTAFLQAARAGSWHACILLYAAYAPGARVFADGFQAVFEKNRRRSNRFSKRELKCLRRAAENGDFSALFNLYN